MAVGLIKERHVHSSTGRDNQNGGILLLEKKMNKLLKMHKKIMINN
jgi:hypothetical protein